MSNILITTPIYYVNDAPHLGTAYTTICSAAINISQRLLGNRSTLQTGTDEHGLKIERTAKAQNLSPKELVDKTSKLFDQTWEKLKLDYTFIRTTNSKHKEFVQKFCNKVIENGFIYKKLYKSLYCVGCEAFKTSKELVDGKCQYHAANLENFEEETYFFKLSAFKEQLLEFYNNSEFLPKNKLNETISILNDLDDISISRSSFTWAIQFPNDPEHVIYVWFDALLNYISTGVDFDKCYHVIGKDILKFHAIYYPAFLLAAGQENTLKKLKLLTHGFITINGNKISKSNKSIKDVSINDLLEKYPADTLKYYLLSQISFGKDGDFSEDSLKTCHNYLVKNLGNLVQRTLSFISKLNTSIKDINIKEEDLDFIAKVEAELILAKTSWSNIDINAAVNHTFAVCTLANQYIDKTAPWTSLKEQDFVRLNTIIAVLTGVFSTLNTYIYVVLPDTAKKIRSICNFEHVDCLEFETKVKPVLLSNVLNLQHLFTPIK